MTPAPGERLQRFVGDWVRFSLKDYERRMAEGWRALLRTNVGRADLLRHEIIQAHTQGVPLGGASWRDLPMKAEAEGWSLEVPLTEVGYFKAKAYLVDPRGWQHWPSGPDVGISVHPDRYRTANTIYCAFVRMFGETRTATSTRDEKLEHVLTALDKDDYTVIPASGKLRELTQQLPHIFGTLGCRILHLLPVNPIPATYARFGRFGSPYAALDLTAIDPALVVFDKRTTGIDQFCELTYATHLHGGRVFLDIVINHTGWGSVLQEKHPEWFLRSGDGTFVSPGVWNATWHDLVELKHQNVALWDELAEVFLTWCGRGVDGFRCDAGYKVPVGAWQYIVARVQQEYPETIFLLEGLGGSWEATETLLTEGGMQWAYSELFQNHSGKQAAGYLEHSFKQSGRVGLLVHYSETHDNERLAARGRAWSLLRNRLCALASVSGGYGFTCGVEWLATERIQVHGNSGLAWGSTDNLTSELAALNGLLADHPCFFDGAKLVRLSPPDSPVLALRRESEEGQDVVLILVNTDAEHLQEVRFELQDFGGETGFAPSQDEVAKGVIPITKFATSFDLTSWVDLLGQPGPEIVKDGSGHWVLKLTAGAAVCLAPTRVPRGLHGEEYRQQRMQAAWAFQALAQLLPPRAIPSRLAGWRGLAKVASENPARFLASITHLAGEWARSESAESFEERFSSLDSLAEALRGENFPPVVSWGLPDRNRITLVPPGHWLLIQDTVPFRASLRFAEGQQRLESVPVPSGHVAAFPPRLAAADDAALILERYAEKDQRAQAVIRFLDAAPAFKEGASSNLNSVLLTNGRGGMARICVDLGRVNSKYDCALGANLHPTLPVDRHVLAKRIRVWVNADGFLSPLNFTNLSRFEAGPPAVWNFVANAGDARTVEIELRADMLEGRNTTVFHFSRASAEKASGKQLPAEAEVRLVVRVDIEDRNFHGETKRNSAAEHHFGTHVHTLATESERGLLTRLLKRGKKPASAPAPSPKVGFAFTPARDRHLHVFSDRGEYHPEPEWCENIPHPIEQTRGQVTAGDAFSPGWFEIPLTKGASARLVITAETSDPDEEELESSKFRVGTPQSKAAFPEDDKFGRQLLRAVRAFVVQRDGCKTVIAGYPWFLDWGRDAFICARGLLAAGMVEEVKQLLVTFARFEKNGTLPNTIQGEDASNRETSDAPLWFAVVCGELAELAGKDFYQTKVGRGGPTLGETLWNIGVNYAKGTRNGIRMDPASALIWSPGHFTWMDTNNPACTPREGYPIEIQALWIRLLRQLEGIGGRTERKGWDKLAAQALASLEELFWGKDLGYYADVILARPGQPAGEGMADDALRSNCLFPISLGLVSGDRARRCLRAALRYLVVPGALRSLAPLPVSVPLPIHGHNGRLLNDPSAPYWGRYEGDEDTRRKPAYHNGTAWTWTFPVFCEALARGWDFAPQAVAAAKAYLGSMDRLLDEGCMGQLPEILDGDCPAHSARLRRSGLGRG